MLTPCVYAEKSNERKMVIINKHSHTKRHTAKRKSSFLSTLSLVLAVLMMLSVSIVGIPTASAKDESPFVDCEEIFIDMRNFTGWTEKSASFRVFTFYNDSDSTHYCHEYEGNFDNDGWYTGSNVLAKGIVPVKFCDNVYSFRIPANNISHLRIVRTNSNGTEKWNLSPYMWDNQRSKYSVGGKSYSKQNAIKINGWDNNASWSTFTPTNNASYSETTAVPDSSITGNSSLYTIDSTFYDYYNDDEIQNGWGNIRYATNHGTPKSSQNGNGYMENAYWEPFSYLNSKIAAHDNGVNYPLYFGNFFDKEDGFKGEGSSEMVHFSNWVNNSSRLGGTHKAIVGLTGSTLVNGDLYYAADGGGNSSTKVPIFDKSWLQSNKVGSVVNTKFPMRKVTSNGVTGYYFDSSSSAANGGDNVWFNSSHNTISYGAGTSNGAKDSLSYYNSDGSSSGYGFFPFDSTRGKDANALDYGFGMRVDVKFNLGADDSSHIGQIKGTNGSYVDQKFNFTGDDDVWVYVDNKLVLDLGGDHQKADGSINFHNRTVSVTTGTNTLNSATRNQSFTLDNYGDPTAEHTLTMFYVERGMVESNLSFNFNFAPIGNELIVDKTVNTEDINTGLKTAVAAADTFSFNQPTANGKVSSKGTISNSTYTLKNAQSISFKDQFAVPTDMTVKESESSPLTYTTSWKAVDLVLKGKGATESQYTIAQSSGDSKTAEFTYQTKDTSSEFAMTRVQLSYVNTPAVAPVSITKTVTGLNVDETDNTDFNGTVEVSLDGGTTWGTYPLQYTFGGNTYTLTSAGKLASNAQLRNGRTLEFAKLPQGAKVRFTEENIDVEHSFVSVTGDSDGISVEAASDNEITVTNQKLRPGAIKKAISIKKTFDGQNYSGKLFKFGLQGLNIPDDTAANAKDTTGITPQNKNTVSNGTVTFDELTFTEEGVYRYFVYEDTSYLAELDRSRSTTYAHDISQTSTNFVATITVTRDGITLTAQDPVFTPTNKTSADDITADDLDDQQSTAVFTNVAKKGSITINKTNQSDEKVGSVQFSLFTLTERQAEELETLSDTEKYDAIIALGDSAKVSEQTTNTNGVAEFTNLNIYEPGYTSSGQPKYQHYALVETAAGSKHNLNKTPMVFTIPQKDNSNDLVYDLEFSYINGKMVNPYTGYFSPLALIRNIGFGIIGVALVLGAVYLLRRKKVFVKYKKKH